MRKLNYLLIVIMANVLVFFRPDKKLILIKNFFKVKFGGGGGATLTFYGSFRLKPLYDKK